MGIRHPNKIHNIYIFYAALALSISGVDLNIFCLLSLFGKSCLGCCGLDGPNLYLFIVCYRFLEKPLVDDVAFMVFPSKPFC